VERDREPRWVFILVSFLLINPLVFNHGGSTLMVLSKTPFLNIIVRSSFCPLNTSQQGLNLIHETLGDTLKLYPNHSSFLKGTFKRKKKANKLDATSEATSNFKGGN
jgi:hypothetical protein